VGLFELQFTCWHASLVLPLNMESMGQAFFSSAMKEMSFKFLV
jgi:hypothetical protein